jgi:hypothetical protein
MHMHHSGEVVKYQYHMEKVIYYEQKCVEYAHHKKYYKRYFKKYCYHKKMLDYYHKKGYGHCCPHHKHHHVHPMPQPTPQAPAAPQPQYQPAPPPAKEQPIYQPQYQPAPFPGKEQPMPFTPPYQQFVPQQRDDLAYPSRSLEYADDNNDYDDY